VATPNTPTMILRPSEAQLVGMGAKEPLTGAASAGCVWCFVRSRQEDLNRERKDGHRERESSSLLPH
jgi:hypothetical protein